MPLVSRLLMLLRSPHASRIVGACCLLGTLALATNGSLQAGSSTTEMQELDSSELVGQRGERSLWVQAGPSPEPATVSSASAPSAAPAQPPVPVAPPAARVAAPAAAPAAPAVEAAPALPPVADLQAIPPAPNLLLPAWAVNSRETALWSGPSGGTEFTRVPPGATFRVYERQEGRFRVFYPGDRRTKRAGEAWVDAAELTAAAWPQWVRIRQDATIVTLPSAEGKAIQRLRRGDFVEVVGEARGSWAHVFFLGDGRGPGGDGWLEADAVLPLADGHGIANFAMSYEQVKNATPPVWLKVPYRSQMDGTTYAEANCGPTTINMALEWFGVRVGQLELRKQVLALQPDENCDDCGTYIQHLATTVANNGLKVHRPRDVPNDPDNYHRWTLDEIRQELQAGRPVVAQVFYRRLPARANSPYWGDHYIVLSGFNGDRFIFNDPIDADGPGYSRQITAQMLDLAMAESDYPHAAFSISK